jgi:hypothetical protein
MTIVASVNVSFDVTRDALEAAIQAAGIAAVVIDQQTENLLRKETPKAVGNQQFRFLKLPFAPDYPVIWARSAAGDIFIEPLHNGMVGGYQVRMIQEFRSNVATGPLILSCNTPQLFAATAAFYSQEFAILAATHHCLDFRRAEASADKLYWAPSGPIYKTVPQLAVKTTQKKAA